MPYLPNKISSDSLFIWNSCPLSVFSYRTGTISIQ